MQLQTILRELKNYDRTFPRRAVQAAIASQEEITPELLSILEYTKQNAERLAVRTRPAYMGHIYALFLLAQFREERAYPLIVDLCTVPSETISELLGDMITEDLNRILASVSGGDPTLMKTLVPNEAVNEWARCAALGGITTLVAQGAHSREDALAYFQSLLRERPIQQDQDIVWSAVVDECADLYPDVVYEDIKQAYADNLVDPMFIGLNDVDDVLARDKEAVLAELKTNHTYTYIDDTIEEMEGWAAFRPSQPRQPRQVTELVQRETVGRNDPCPCGSGRKYKHCCGKRA